MKPIWKREILRKPDGEGAGGGGGDAPAAGADAGKPDAAAQAAANAAAAKEGGAGGDAGKEEKKPAAPKEGAAALNDALGKDSKGDPGKDDGKPGDGAKDGGDPSKQDGEGEADEEGEGKDGDEPKLHGAPEGDYQPFKMPEGREASPEVLAMATPVLKELNLSQDGAQKVAELFMQVTEHQDAQFYGEINAQFDQFQGNPEYWKNGKLTPDAEKAYGVLRNVAPGLVDFAHRQGGLFHPELAKVAFLLKDHYGEAGVDKGDPAQSGEGWRDFYNQPSNSKGE